MISARVLSRVLPDQVTTPSSCRSPRCTARIASRVMVIPFRHTCTTSRGVRVNAPHPVSLLVITNPANTTGLSAPAAPVNGLRYPASSTGASTRTSSQTTRTYIRRSVRSHPSIRTGYPELADAVERGEQHVEVVDDLVPVGQERPRRPAAAVAAQAADQELPLIPSEPAVHVRVVQAGLLLAQLPQVGAGDAELVRDPLIAHIGRDVGTGGHGHAAGAQDRFGLPHHQPRAVGVDRGGGGDDVDLPGLLVAQQRGEVLQRGVPGTRYQGCRRCSGWSWSCPSADDELVRVAGASRRSGQQGAVQGRGPHLPAGPGGQDVFPAGPARAAPAKPAPSGPTRRSAAAQPAPPRPAVREKISARPGRAQREAGCGTRHNGAR